VIVKGTGGSCLKQMMDAYTQVGGNIIAVDEVPQERVNQYGVIDPVKAGDEGPLVKMKGMVEKPPIDKAPSRLKITGRYILQPEVFDLLATQTPGAGGEIQLTDAMQRLMSSARISTPSSMPARTMTAATSFSISKRSPPWRWRTRNSAPRRGPFLKRR